MLALVILGGIFAFTSRPVDASAQQPFIDAVQAGQDAPVRDNDAAVVVAKQERGAAICDILHGNRKVADWTGTVEKVDTELGGDKGTLSIEIAPDVAVATAQGGFLDTDTMVDPSSDLFATLGSLQPGQEVRFSGEFETDSSMCIKEGSLMSRNGLLTPDFLMTFTAVDPVG